MLRTHDSTGYLRDLVDQGLEALFVFDASWRIRDVNNIACEILGYSRGQLLEMSVWDIEQEHRFALTPEFWERVQAGEVKIHQGVHRSSDGTDRRVCVRMSGFESQGMQLICATARPVTDLSEQAAASALSSNRAIELDVFRELFECSSEAVAIIDHTGCYLRQNPAHRVLLGYSDEDLVDKTPAIHLGPAAFEVIAKELAERGRYEGEYTSHTKSGIERRIHLSAFTVPGRDGQPPLFVGIMRDLSAAESGQRARAEHEVTELQERLRQAQKMEVFGELAAGVAHDFNNLLTPIMGYAESEMLARDTQDSTHYALTEILDSARRGRVLTSQLLIFARKQVCSMQDVDLRQLVSESNAMLRRLLPASIEIEIDVPEEFDSVRCDPNQIQQVLVNLVTNARDAMPDGGRLSIQVSDVEVTGEDPLVRVLGAAGAYVRVSVSDTGVGMDDNTLVRLFEPFYSRKPAGLGTGLGLSIAYGIVTQHGGYIQAHSELGRGSTLRFFLPRMQPDQQPSLPVPEHASARDRETVLVAEDEAPVRTLVVRLLQTQGYNVLAAESGEHALEVAEQHDGPIHMLLTDVVMPGCNGRDLYRDLVQRRPNLLVLYMTGYARIVLGDDALDAGASIIEKPFSATELSSKVRSVLRAGIERA